VAVLWPNKVCSTFTLAPALMASEAQVWRKSVSQASPSSRESDTGPSNFR
jgi:hypothetical protein